MLKSEIIIELALTGTDHASIADLCGVKITTVAAICSRARANGIAVPKCKIGRKPVVKVPVVVEPKIRKRMAPRQVSGRDTDMIAMRQAGNKSEAIAIAMGTTRTAVDNVLSRARRRGEVVLKLASGPIGPRRPRVLLPWSA